MRINFYCIVFLLAAFPLFQVSGEEDSWKRDKAVCRLKLFWPPAAEESCLPLDRYSFPFNPADGAAAFSPSGRRIPFFRSEKSQALIFPARDREKYPEDCFYLYLGENLEDPLPGEAGEKDYHPAEDRSALKLEGVYSRQSGNMLEYRQQTHQNLQRNLTRSYEDLQRNLSNFFIYDFISPSFLCRPVFNGWWDITRYAAEQCQRPVSKFLYNARGLNRSTRWRLTNIYPMRIFFYRPDNRRYQMRNIPQRYINTKKNLLKRWDNALAATEDEVLYPALKASFEDDKSGRRRRRHLSEKIPKVSLAPRELDLWGNLAIRFSGKLFIQESGLYEFEVSGNTLWMLEIDGKTLGKGLSNPELPPDSASHFSCNLARGTYAFNFYCSRSDDTEDIHVRIRTGAGPWESLDTRYFIPAPPLEAASLELRSGEPFPIVRRKELGTVFTGKTKSFRLTEFTADGELYWAGIGDDDRGGKITLAEQRIGAVPAGGEADWGLADRRGNVITPSASGNELFMSVQKIGGNGELVFPQTLYDDEKFDITAALYSQLPFDLDIRVDGEFSPLKDGPESFRRGCLLPGRRRVGRSLRFAESGELKLNFPFDAGKIDRVLDMSFRFYLPGLELSRLSGRIMPVSMLPDKLGYEGLHLTDADGVKLTPVMHRPSLSEQREWELLRVIMERNFIPREIVFIGGEPQIPDAELDALEDKYKLVINRLRWPERDHAGRSRLLRGVAELLPELKNLTADTVVLVPPEGDMANLPAELNARYIALMLEVLGQNMKVKRVLLAPPAPGLRPDEELWTKDWDLRLRRLAREYGIEFLELNAAPDPLKLLEEKCHLSELQY